MLIFTVFLNLVGCIAFYMTSPHQCLLRRALDPRPWRGLALVLIGLALLLWVQVFSVAGGIFSWILLCMIAWSMLPYIGLALSERSPGNGKQH